MGNTKRLEIGEPYLEFRGDCLLYLCYIDRKCKMKWAYEIDGASQKPIAALENRIKEPVATTKGEMVTTEHFALGIIEITMW